MHTKSCKIIIKDEVNCKIEGLELHTRRRCTDALKFMIPYAYNLPSYKLGRWDGKVSYFSIGGATYINLLDRILGIIEKDGYEVNIEDKRPDYNFRFDKVDKESLLEFKWSDSHPTQPGQPIELFDHQIELINNFLDNLQGIQIAPTSSGKTIVTGVLSKKIEKYGRSIVIVPNKNLVVQTERDYKLLGLDVGVFFGDRKEINKTHTISTWQSLESLRKKTKNNKINDEEVDINEFLNGVVAVICDECHSSKAQVLKSLLTTEMANIPIRWGLTGTMPKVITDEIPVLASIGNVIGKLEAKELQDLGILSNCHINIIQLKNDKKRVGNYQDEMKFLANDKPRIEFISSIVDELSLNGNTLVLVEKLEVGNALKEKIKDSVFISGKIKLTKREEEYSDVATSDNKVIIATYGVASTGINIPRIFNLVLYEPGKSFTRTIQSIGRSLRRASDKDFANIYDMCSTTHYSSKHMKERVKFYQEMKYPCDISVIDIS